MVNGKYRTFKTKFSLYLCLSEWVCTYFYFLNLHDEGSSGQMFFSGSEWWERPGGGGKEGELYRASVGLTASYTGQQPVVNTENWAINDGF